MVITERAVNPEWGYLETGNLRAEWACQLKSLNGYELRLASL